MKRKNHHIILLGFKHAGKSSVGKALAARTQRQFIDLDEEIEQDYKGCMQKSLICREIFNQHGEEFFRDRETRVLKKILNLSAAVIAVGGGAPLRQENRALLQTHWLVHVTADPTVIYARIIYHGIPAFFAEKVDPIESFCALWEARQPIYAKLADCTVDNTQTINKTLIQILQHWEQLA